MINWEVISCIVFYLLYGHLGFSAVMKSLVMGFIKKMPLRDGTQTAIVFSLFKPEFMTLII